MGPVVLAPQSSPNPIRFTLQTTATSASIATSANPNLCLKRDMHLSVSGGCSLGAIPIATSDSDRHSLNLRQGIDLKSTALPVGGSGGSGG
jgi:hypothetical protein